MMESMLLNPHMPRRDDCFLSHGWVAASSSSLFQLLTGTAPPWPSSLFERPTPNAELSEQTYASFVRWRLFVPELPVVSLGHCAVGLLEGLGRSAPTLCMVRIEIAGWLRQRLRFTDPSRVLLAALHQRRFRDLTLN